MKRNSSILFCTLLFFLLSSITVSAQETEQSFIKILFPLDEVTYGPWSDTYFDYPRTGTKAHHIRVTVNIDDENVAYYQLMRNNEYVSYTGNESHVDAISDNSIIEFKPDDLQPLDLVGYLSAFQELTAIAYAADGSEIGRDTVTFYIAVNLDDYYELVSTQEELPSTYTVDPALLAGIGTTEEIVEESSYFFTIKKTVTLITVRNRFTGETEEHTRVQYTIEPLFATAAEKAIDVYTVIPKAVVGHLGNLTLAGNYSVIDADPVMMWHFGTVQSAQTIEYDINVPVNTQGAEAIIPILIADVEGSRTSWYFLIPLVIPVVLLFAIIYFAQFKKRVSKK